MKSTVTILEKVMYVIKHLIANTEWENRVYLVGGAVRDEIMQRESKDFDFVVDGNLTAGVEFAEWLCKKINVYNEDTNPVIFKKYGTANMRTYGNDHNLPEVELEFVAPRREKYTDDSRNPEVFSGDLMCEVLRRDLTINSLLKNVSTGEILDLLNLGFHDIENGIIRTCDEANKTYNDDPLRMMRAIRFETVYNFKMTDSTFAGITENASRITIIPRERICNELNKILMADKPSDGIKQMIQTGLMSFIIPEIPRMIYMTQNEHHTDDVFDHTMMVLNNTPKDLKTRMMALFHDIGKIKTRTVDDHERVHFFGHEEVGAEMTKDILTGLKGYPKEFINDVVVGVQHHMYLKHAGNNANITPKALRKFITSVGVVLPNVLDLIHADNISHAEASCMPDQISQIRVAIEALSMALNVEEKNIKLPINGFDIIRLGIPKGPQIKEVKNAILAAWYENPNIDIIDAVLIVNTFLKK